MDAFDEAIDPESSQASLVLQDLITEDDTNWTANEANGQDRKYQRVPDDHLKDISPSRSLSSLPRYHYHGLANTQTQSQQCDDDQQLRQENLRKKSNKGAAASKATLLSGFVKDGSNSVSHKSNLSSHNKSKHVNEKQASTSTLQSSSRGKTSIATHKQAKAVLTAHSKVQGCSQDSFACEPSPDPEERFVATSKQFEIPLSELGRTHPSVKGKVNAVCVGFKSTRSHSVSKDGTRRSAVPEGNVLVASTPSQDGDSQSQDERSQVVSDKFEETQSANRYNDFALSRTEAMDVDHDSEGSGYESSEHSSSFVRLLKGESDPSEEISELQATQPATQPSTQPAGVEMEDPGNPWILPAASDSTKAGSNFHNPASTSQATTSTGRRGLLSMVNPLIHYRYQKYQKQPSVPPPEFAEQNVHQVGHPFLHQGQQLQPSPIGQPIATGGGWQETQPSVPSRQQQTRPSVTSPAIQETQPSFEDQGTGPSPHHVGLARSVRDINSLRSPSTSNNVSSHPAKDIDFLDVIPDSEPLRSDSHVAALSRQGGHGGKNASTSKQEPAESKDLQNATALNTLLIDDEGELTEMTDDSEPQKLGNTAEEEENSGSDDDDDVPLAARIASTSKRTMPLKQNKPVLHVNGLPPKTKDAHEASSLGRNQRQVRSKLSRDQGQKLVAVPSPIKTIPRRSIGITEIPSSVAEQPVQKAALTDRQPRPTVAPKLSDQNKKAIAPPKSARNLRSTITTQRGRTLSKQHAEKIESDDELLMSNEQKGSEDESASEAEYMEVDQPVAESSSRKRKRAAQPSRSIATRNSSKSTAKSAATPSTRYTKRLKPAISTNSRPEDATRVFALWKQDGYYYPGYVNRLRNDMRYEVKFDDNTTADLNLDQMRRCDLHIGDDVIVANLPHAYKVISLDQSEGVVTLEIDGPEDFNIKDLRLAHKTVLHAWKDRTLSAGNIITAVHSFKGKPSPTPSKTSSIASSTSSKILSGTGLIVTLRGGGHWEKEKERVMNIIRTNGGKVIDDVSTIIRMEGSHSKSGNRWSITKSDVKWNGVGLHRLLLVADDANQKPKFLIALALGIPCVSTEWLDKLGDKLMENWTSFLLPQGYSEALGARASQQIDFDWGNSIHQLKQIMSNAVPCKLFAEKSVLCVGPEMIPQPRGKRLPGVDEKGQEAINAVARIILAMGAEYVEAVTDIQHATSGVSAYDFVIIREASHYSPELSDATTVHWNWVKDCLIASRYLPLPVWPGESEESQDL